MTRARPKTPGRVTPTELKLQAGRPRKQAPPDAVEVVREAAATGASKIGCAMALGTSQDVFNRWLDEDPLLAQAFAHGREKERQTLHAGLFDAAAKGNIVAAMFLLKARHGYQEGQQEGQANRVSINFTIPGAQPLSDFMVIDNADDRTKSVPAKTIERS